MSVYVTYNRERGSVTHMLQRYETGVAALLAKRASRCRAVFYLSKRSPWRNNEGGQSGAAQGRVSSRAQTTRIGHPDVNATESKEASREDAGRILWGTRWGRRCDAERAGITFCPLKDPLRVRFMRDRLTSKWSKRDKVFFFLRIFFLLFVI